MIFVIVVVLVLVFCIPWLLGRNGRLQKERPKREKARPDMPDQPDYYQVLGIRRDASPQQIRDIYVKLAFIYHPDTGKFLGIDGDQRFRQIQEAYETLSNPIKRREYDREIGVT